MLSVAIAALFDLKGGRQCFNIFPVMPLLAMSAIRIDGCPYTRATLDECLCSHVEIVSVSSTNKDFHCKNCFAQLQ